MEETFAHISRDTTLSRDYLEKLKSNNGRLRWEWNCTTGGRK